MKRPFIALIILDGWGHREEKEGNAVALADTPFFDRLWAGFPRTLIHASEERVGLPAGQMGNSEVGHLNLGAGRVVYQDLVRISKSVRTGDFFRNPVLCAAMDAARENGKALHLVGLLSDGGVHSLRHAPLRAAADGEGARRPEGVPPPRVRRAGHPAAKRDRPPPGLAGEGGRDRRRGGGHRRRPVLHDGPRQPVGPRRARVQGDGPRGREELRRPRGRRRRVVRGGEDRRVHRARGDRAGRPAGRTDRPRRLGDLLQLPGRPRARDHPGADAGDVRPLPTTRAAIPRPTPA